MTQLYTFQSLYSQMKEMKMNKNILSIILLLALSTLSYGGGGVTPAIVPVVPIITESSDDSHFYVGLGLSSMSLRNDVSDEEFSAGGVMLQAGYQVNQYLAIEGRYTHDITDVEYEKGDTRNPNFDDYNTDFSNIALYLKPMYTKESFTFYGLLGYGETQLNNLPFGLHPILSADRVESGFQWGVGAAYTLNENISIFADYVRMHDDKEFDGRATNSNIVADAWTLGLSYVF